MKKMFIACILAFFVIFVPVPLVSQSLDWQIQFLKGAAAESVPVNETIRMENVGEFQLNIKADSDGYCYVICYGSNREIFVLYNQAVKSGTEIKSGPVYITTSSGRNETIFVIMSLSKQTDLEGLMANHATNPSPQHTQNLYRGISSLQRTVSGLGEPRSAILTSAGTDRSPGNNDRILGTKFSGKDIYVQPITIRP